MDIVNFFETVEGTWFSQRTTHRLPAQTSHTGQTTLEITRLAAEDATVARLCQQYEADPSHTLVAFQVSHEGGQPTLLVALKPDQDSDSAQNGAAETGRFLSQTGTAPATSGQYHLEGDALTFVSEAEGRRSQERLWYLNPNLRMRTCLVDQADGTQLATFCSEIRRGLTRPAS
ncbi:phycobiliprotein lyase [Leptolyngbya sp. PCC 6406]|uniref:phycobiliprotein lyase n=1 Tax=Leptolyngbya sp. PCC 6406 TaxID=1173264 RepID=UPI0002AC37E0|nr:phycobiliprotein lyase [Leptolyngbya sp. PCC 6406]